MKEQNVHFRHILLYYFRKGKNASQAQKKLCAVYEDEALKERQFRNWFERFRSGTKEKHWTVALSDIPDWPRIEAVAEFRLRTGHDCLAKHLHRFGVYTQPTCPLCNLQEAMEKAHLIRCPALKTRTESQRYWEARRQLMNCY
ncbi:unnamed protein product [Rodentolepis nana]|uniref:HTH_48 domain-containing protein n=1 Tax=Rodentolepis nana TaxID=102285 RepID=A0A0R3TY42_RODNA|nr:unnamed protein product [Rodentolepis nana]